MQALRCFTRSGVALVVAVVVLLPWATAAQAQRAARPLAASTHPHWDMRSPDARDSAEGRPSPAEIFTLVRLVPDRRAPAAEASGFHVRDAVVGAGVATGLILLTAGTVLSLRRRQRPEMFSVVIHRSL
jgi:hypothetical protein